MSKREPRHITHGMSNTRLYRTYRDMINRCNGIAKKSYDNYYARGIKVCKEWDTFEKFRDWALANGYDDTLTIDRIDVNGNYSPDNCRFTTRKLQNNNTRANHYVEYRGERLTIAQWAERLGINQFTLHSRISIYKWSVEKAFTTPVRRLNRNEK